MGESYVLGSGERRGDTGDPPERQPVTARVARSCEGQEPPWDPRTPPCPLAGGMAAGRPVGIPSSGSADRLPAGVEVWGPGVPMLLESRAKHKRSPY
ncbi:hypothetical protein GCM10009639_68040 [Kitasatospora putterlickiae]|uniref:Uncharacterized protein n=1 Tax=Kitasatospora putterlickiae TaxID=221725 RepID=A0ABP4J6A8_9ACTN